MRRVFFVLLSVLTVTAGPFARAESPTFMLWDLDSPAPVAPKAPSAESPQKQAFDDLDQKITGPQIWRLPPVEVAGGVPAAVAPTPVAFNMPPIDDLSLPAMDEKIPFSNAPASLSGLLSSGDRVETKPDADKLWDGSFDLGLDGSQGNSETTNFRLGFHAKRREANNILTLSLDYNKQSANSVSTADHLYFDERVERLIADSRWSVFAHETVEYDEFQSFNVRDTSDFGMGYRLVRTSATTLISRLGAGFSHEFGGPENGLFIPEIVFSMQLERHISKRQKLLGEVEYAPDVGKFLRYRIRAQAAWEMLLDQEKNLSLRVGVLEIYNSMPGTAQPNDLNYATTLLWKF